MVPLGIYADGSFAFTCKQRYTFLLIKDSYTKDTSLPAPLTHAEVSTTEGNEREVETISFTLRTRLLGRNSKA